VPQAGPGSGKTRVVVARIHHLLVDRHVPPEQVVTIAFTNKAAKELQERLQQALEEGGAHAHGHGHGHGPGQAYGVSAKTFHGLGLWILKQLVPHEPSLPYTSFPRIMDEDQVRARAANEVQRP
jgi:DNA helicase-2/ATP-dependent DNA helicase PcrA